MIKVLEIIFAGLLFLALSFLAVSWFGFRAEKDVEFGVTFSPVMARQLGLDEREVFEAIVEDLGVRKIRLPVYWSDVEEEPGKFGFVDYDYFVKKAEGAGAKLILAVGRKLPRWPECHIQEWSRDLPEVEFENAAQSYLKTVVERYKRSPAVAAWQLENEHFHKFGAECAADKLSSEVVDRELALIRSLDGRPVLLTDAGEGGWWGTSLQRSNFLGVSMYYQVWNPWWGVFWSPLGPGSYALKKYFFEALYPGSKIIVAELQAEPFGGRLLPDYDLAVQRELMNTERFREVIRRARRAGFAENYLWGAEWWYWLKEEQNDPGLWNEAKKLFVN